MRTLLTLLVLSAFTGVAADITGKWKGAAETPNGTVERTFEFKQDGTKLTGETVSDFSGKSTIENGKVEGNDVTFSIQANFQGNALNLLYKGKIAGDEITFDVEFREAPGEAPRIRYVAKRLK